MPNIFFGKNVTGEVIERERDDGQMIKIPKDYTYGDGTRIPAQIEIAFNILNNGGTLQEYLIECENCGLLVT